MSVAIPHWLKTDPFACYTVDRTIFRPQRRLIFANGVPSLLDCRNQTYPLVHCDRLHWDDFKGAALLVTGQQRLTVYPDFDGGLIITDGRLKQKVILTPPDDALEAARSLAQFFQGVVIPEEAPDQSASNRKDKHGKQ
ncbi:hypothetical protein [Stenomitos frigidus]|uniref:Uncharacterized protein n=1 Tax=Stenomitos frigidus ULC18 TaxID=2107698 RepID=A0A2T1DY21_9CYAN|nr:hypothetical protein [Stenomitos frigidus]PSB25369.1 hypothetical protein C7B82_23865 [Stenomitos frigidus ULC18]